MSTGPARGRTRGRGVPPDDAPVALVTGGSRGIGRACAIRFADAGFRVAYNYHRDRDAARSLELELGARGAQSLCVQADLASPSRVRAFVDAAHRRWNRLDVLVNNAGVAAHVPLEAITAAEWDALMAINLRAAFLASQRAIPFMKAQGGGCIVMISSQAGQTGGFLAGAHYSASKAGLISLTKTLARELGASNIRVNCVAPGIIDTDMVRAPRVRRLARRAPLGRIGTADDVARAVLFLSTDQSAYITGATIPVNGGIYMP